MESIETSMRDAPVFAVSDLLARRGPGDDEIAVLQNLHVNVGKITHGCAPD